MSTEVLYRKWRPRAFAELAGQDAVVRTLTNAVASDKVAHAYLLSGPRGTGKTTTGRLLAKALNCSATKDGEPCNECESCLSYLETRALDLVELDAASNRGIDEIRSLREKAQFVPSAGEGAYKVYLIDEVHMLTDAAFNALLKTLEEPPPHVVFVLATTDAHKVPATVISRCQRFDFRRIPLAAIVDRLAFIAENEGFTCPPEGLEAIARTATGSLRDSINLLEQLVDSYGATLSLEHVREGLGLVVDARSGVLAAHAVRGELAPGLGVIASVRDDGLDLRQFQRQVVAYLRALLLVKAGAPSSEVWSDEQLAEMSDLVSGVPAERVVAALRSFGEADLRDDPLSPLPLEIALATTVLAPADSPAAAGEPAPPAPAPAAAPKARKAAPASGSTSRVTPRTKPAERPAPPPAARPDSKKKKAQGPQAAQPQSSEQAPPAQPESKEKTAPALPASAEAPVEPDGTSDDVSPQVAEVRSHWQKIYDRTREIDFRAGALLNSGCGIIQASEDEIVFGFRHSMLLDRMQGDGGQNLRAFQQAIEDVLGSGKSVRCVLDPNVEVLRPGGSRGGHLVRAVEEMGGRVLPDDG